MKSGYRKFTIAAFAILCITMLGFAKRPEVASAIAGIAVAFLAAHGVADSKWGRNGSAS